MATFLELCQTLSREIDVSTAAPQSVENQTGQLLDVVEWIRDAWREIQTDRSGHWRWLRGRFQFDTVVGQVAYPLRPTGSTTHILDADSGLPITRFNEWRLRDHRHPPYVVKPGNRTPNWLTYRGYESLMSQYGTFDHAAAQPAFITESPDHGLRLAPSPSTVSTVHGEYWKGPQVLLLNDDVPECPEQFHRVIVWYAMVEFGFQQAAQEAVLRAERNYNRVISKLAMNQSQAMQMTSAGPLA